MAPRCAPACWSGRMAPAPGCARRPGCSRATTRSGRWAWWPISSVACPISLDQAIAPRIALAGDAAHVVHPLAGQGMNLGLGDAESLARVLAAPGVRDPGDPLVLRRYQRSRREEVSAMRWTTDGLDWLFHAGLALVDGAMPLKSALVRQALG